MKNLFPVVLMLLSTCAFADEMQFITVLSTPVGSFNRLEAVDPSAPVQSTTVNFCTKIGTEGRVQLKGNNNVGIENANLSTNTTLGRSSEGDYVLQKITLNSAGSVTGSRLLSNVVKVSGQGVGKSSNLYGTTLTVTGAKTKGLNVGNGKSVMVGTGSATEMVWSNEYQNDTAACGTNCKQQYLLKSKGSASSGNAGEKKRCLTKLRCLQATIESFCSQKGNANCRNGTPDWLPNAVADQTIVDVINASSQRDNMVDMVTEQLRGLSCFPGQECDGCVLHKRYYYRGSSGADGNPIYSWVGNCNVSSGPCTLFVSIPYAICEEMYDCATGENTDCQKWSGGDNSTSVPWPLPNPFEDTRQQAD